MTSGAVGAIDCGTNSTRLLVAGPDGQALERLARITRLGQGVDESRLLRADAIERTAVVLREYRSVMDKFGVERVRMTATSAARDAINRDEFFAAAEAAVGVRPELLTGDQEARLSFAGATQDLGASVLDRSSDSLLLVLDIGGGSTEFVVGRAGPGDNGDRAPLGAVSVDMGCVRLTERYLTDDPPTPAQVEAASAAIDAYIDQVIDRVPEVSRATALVGLAGSVVTLASLDQRLAVYDRSRLHHYRLRREAVEALTTELLAHSTAERRSLPGMEPARADVLPAGGLVLTAVMDRFDFASCLVSESDILDGLALSLLQADRSSSGKPT